VNANMPPPISSSDETLYYALIEGQERGPYQLDFIEALVLSSVCGPDVKIRRKDKTQWISLDSIVPPSIPLRQIPKQSPPPIAQKRPPAPAKKGSGCGSVAWTIFVIVIVSGISKSCNSSTSTYTPRTPSYTPPPAYTYTPPAPPPVVAPEQTQPVDSPANLNPTTPQTLLRPAEPAPVAEVPAPIPSTLPSPPQNPPETDDSIVDDSGHTFRVPHAYTIILDAKKAGLNRLLGSINQLKRSRAAAGRQIDLDRANLDNTDQAAVDSFNVEVDRYNQQGDLLDKTIDQYNAGIQNYNDYLSKIGTPTN
jgi:hypothetical protein